MQPAFGLHSAVRFFYLFHGLVLVRNISDGLKTEILIWCARKIHPYVYYFVTVNGINNHCIALCTWDYLAYLFDCLSKHGEC